MKYNGSCHCGKIKYAIEAPENITLISCNCTICYKLGAINIHLDRKDFDLTSNNYDDLTEYRFHTKLSTYYFCKFCGICPFHTSRRDPNNRVVVNFRTIDNQSVDNFNIEKYNGIDWI
ncbi:Mss4-like protein [Cunninghamella echinulata]|nr:Mss4-like protein [Cunninghamella echinulata]